MKKILFLFFIFLSCNYLDDVYYFCESEFEPYLNVFEKEGAKRGFYFDRNNLIVRWVTEEQMNTKGKAFASATIDGPIKYINVKRSSWDFLLPLEKEIVILHELGHAILHRDHSENQFSIMYPSANTVSRNYLEFRDLYFDELFNINQKEK